MSAGGLSYHGLTTSRKTTLPSVEMWGTDMNILKDPPRGITTRRIDKVGQTQSILLSQEDSGDRIAECINVYARGVNPMVSVSYDNYGNNGGATGSARRQGVKLPYKPEVFRPPVFRQEDLLPLSRMPRNFTYSITSNPELPNIVQHMGCNETKYSTTDDRLRVEALPSYRRNIETVQPVSGRQAVHAEKATYEVLSGIKSVKGDDFRYIMKNLQTAALLADPLRMSADAVRSGHEVARADNPESVSQARREVRHLDVGASLSAPTRDAEMQKTTSQGIHENKLAYEILTQKIKKMDGILTDTNPTKGVHDSILSPSAAAPHSSTHSYTDSRTVSAPSRYSVRDVETFEVHAKPTSSYVLEGENRFDSAKYIVPGERMGSWVSSSQQKPYQGGETVASAHIAAASKPFLYKEVASNPATPLQWTEGRVGASSHSVRDIQSLNVETARTRTDLQMLNKPEHMDRPMLQNRPLGSVESINKRAPTTRTLIHDVMSAGAVEHNPMNVAANTAKTSYDKRGEFGDAHLDRRVLLVEGDTARNTTALGSNVYSVQSTDAEQYVSNRPAAGGFEGGGNAIPRSYMETQRGVMPIDSNWNLLKKEAYRQFQTRND